MKPLRVLHTSDIHLGLGTFAQPGVPQSRLADLDEVLNRFVGAAKSQEADLAIISGDLFDSRHPKPREIAVALRFVGQLSVVCPVYIVDGNHDGAWVIHDPSSRTLRILDEAQFGAPDAGWGGVTVALGPMVSRIHTKSGYAVLVSIPFPHKRAYDASHAGMDPLARHEQLSRDVERAIGVLYEQAREEALPDEPIIFAGHLTAVGSLVGSERMMRLEDDISVGSPVLDLFDYAALGHIHRQQRVGRKAYYPGAPEFVDFGEAGQPKGFLLAEVERGRDPVVTVIDSRPRPLVTYQTPPGAAGVTFGPPEDMPAGAIVRVRMEFPDRAAAKAAKGVADAFYAAGASYVQTDVVVPDQGAPRARAVSHAATPDDKLRAFLSLQGVTDQEPYLTAFRELAAASAS